MLLGSIEFRDREVTCAVSDGHINIKDKVEIPLDDPKTTFYNIVKYFKNVNRINPIGAIGVSSFGPLELRNYSPKYGYITDSSRKNWSNINLLGTLKHYLNCPMSFTTDVNSTAYGEYIQSILNDKPIMSLVYITISKGVGAGIINNGEMIGYQGSPEIGHIYPKRPQNDQGFKGTCPYQGDCLEGLVAEPTFQARFNKSYNEISMFNPIWDDVAYYIAQSIIQATLFIRPQKIILGGTIINPILLKKIKIQFNRLFNHYVPVGDHDNLNNYITLLSSSSSKLAIIGNISLAKKAYFSNFDMYQSSIAAQQNN
ncbi:fructokinase [Philodulcilactobacillus myokoensis]|uniref:fructokinase n=1 Tax=Philodulcilactobacillus myokoensis TaxID=2929573 RepID=A0A9W6AZH6_9LACO|nr:ROK family protein [Philodulcilactobacillus myokoensis]GLB46285.1 fructokinase [Philodulcilactobacillus myokoensis]